MCLIILNPAGESLPMEHIENGWSDNPHGAGFMFVDDAGKLQIRKPFFKLKLLRHELEREHRLHGKTSPFVIHFRWATHGEKTAENTHPHPVCGGSVGLAHNGVLHDFLPPYGEECSDTVWFCRTVLSYRRGEDVMDGTFKKILADMIGKGSKFVLLHASRKYSIVNESAGVWDNGRWYSNDSYKPAPTWKSTRAGTSTLFIPSRRRASHDDQLLPETLFGRRDAWDELDAEIAGNELADLQDELDMMQWEDCTEEERTRAFEVIDRIMKLEAELESNFH